MSEENIFFSNVNDLEFFTNENLCRNDKNKIFDEDNERWIVS